MSVIYCVLLTMTLLVSTVVSQAGTIINVYSRDSKVLGDQNKAGKIEPSRSVAFSVGRKGSFAPSSTSRIPMDHEFYNKGKYFDMKTNIFTAPVSGVYGFYYGASSPNGKDVHLYLHVGNPQKSIASTYDYNKVHGQASGFVIVEMKRGDHASVWLHGNHAINAQTLPSTYFTGFLVAGVGNGVIAPEQC